MRAVAGQHRYEGNAFDNAGVTHEYHRFCGCSTNRVFFSSLGREKKLKHIEYAVTRLCHALNRACCSVECAQSIGERNDVVIPPKEKV